MLKDFGTLRVSVLVSLLVDRPLRSSRLHPLSARFERFAYGYLFFLAWPTAMGLELNSTDAGGCATKADTHRPQQRRSADHLNVRIQDPEI